MLLLLVHPLALTSFLEGPLENRLQTTSDMSLLLQDLALFGAATVLKYDWRFGHNPAIGWISAMLAMISIQNLPFSLLAVAGSTYGGFGKVNGFSSVLVRLLMILILLAAADGRRQPPLRNPLVLGIAVGSLIGAGRLLFVLPYADPSLHPGLWGGASLQVVVWVLTAVIGAQLISLADVAPWIRSRLVVALVLLAGSASFPVEGGFEPTTYGRLMMGAIGATLIAATAVGATRATIRENARALVSLAHRAATAEAAVRHGKEQLHELNATVAGVAQASRLLLQDGGPNAPHRKRLQALVDAEMHRLERMLVERSETAVSEVALDDLIEPLVTLQRTLGQEVGWKPGGHHAVVRPDDITEVLHILLVNAARHAPGAVTTVSTHEVGGQIELRVADDGPGIDPWLRRNLFRWGNRRPDSPGHGIGLQLGRRLMTELGGDLRLEEPVSGTGAVFVAVMPAASERASVADEQPAVDALRPQR